MNADPSVQQQVPYYQPFMYVQPHVQDGVVAQPFHYAVPQSQFQLPTQQYVQQPPQAAEQSFYPQIPVQQPQYAFQTNETETTTPTNDAPCPRNRCKRFNAYKIGGFMSIAAFVAYFLVTPGAFPWFLVIHALSAGAMLSKYVREHYADNEARFLKHLAWFSSINIAFLLVNLWSGGFPWSTVPIAVWGAIIGFHGVSIYNRDPLLKRLVRHVIIYLAVGLIILVCFSYIPSFGPNNFNRVRSARKDHANKEQHHVRSNMRKMVFARSHLARPNWFRNKKPHPTATQAQTTTTVKPENKKEDKKQEKQKHGDHKQKGEKHKSRPNQSTKSPSEEREDKFHEEYARERARNDSQQRFTFRIIGLGIMALWTVVLLVHALKTKRALRARRNQQMVQAQQADLQSVAVQQQPTGLIQ